jgi:hypothetical protein
VLEGMILALGIFLVGMLAGGIAFLALHWNDEAPEERWGGDGFELPDYPPSDLDVFARR